MKLMSDDILRGLHKHNKDSKNIEWSSVQYLLQFKIKELEQIIYDAEYIGNNFPKVKNREQMNDILKLLYGNLNLKYIINATISIKKQADYKC